MRWARESRVASDVRCPICTEGVLSAISYDRHDPVPAMPKQAPESREVLTFSCGHEVEARRLAEAAADDPNVERRRSDETVMPADAGGGRRG